MYSAMYNEKRLCKIITRLDEARDLFASNKYREDKLAFAEELTDIIKELFPHGILSTMEKLTTYNRFTVVQLMYVKDVRTMFLDDVSDTYLDLGKYLNIVDDDNGGSRVATLENHLKYNLVTEVSILFKQNSLFNILCMLVVFTRCIRVIRDNAI